MTPKKSERVVAAFPAPPGYVVYTKCADERGHEDFDLDFGLPCLAFVVLETRREDGMLFVQILPMTAEAGATEFDNVINAHGYYAIRAPDGQVVIPDSAAYCTFDEFRGAIAKRAREAAA